jgi:hypothetical protein
MIKMSLAAFCAIFTVHVMLCTLCINFDNNGFGYFLHCKCNVHINFDNNGFGYVFVFFNLTIWSP